MAHVEAFIKFWKKSYVDFWNHIVKETLDQGFTQRGVQAFQPRSMESMAQQHLYAATTFRRTGGRFRCNI